MQSTSGHPARFEERVEKPAHGALVGSREFLNPLEVLEEAGRLQSASSFSASRARSVSVETQRACEVDEESARWLSAFRFLT
jgi:hypothetical protein